MSSFLLHDRVWQTQTWGPYVGNHECCDLKNTKAMSCPEVRRRGEVLNALFIYVLTSSNNEKLKYDNNH